MSNKEFEIVILIPHSRKIFAPDARHAVNVAKATVAQIKDAILTRVSEVVVTPEPQMKSANS